MGKKELEIPDYLTAALKKNKTALATFKEFNYSSKKDYVEWITEAKTEDTRNKRLDTAIDRLYSLPFLRDSVVKS